MIYVLECSIGNKKYDLLDKKAKWEESHKKALTQLGAVSYAVAIYVTRHSAAEPSATVTSTAQAQCPYMYHRSLLGFLLSPV